MSNHIESNGGAEAGSSPVPCSAFSDTERLTWLIRENADSLIDPSWAREGQDPQAAVRERIDKHMMRRPNVKGQESGGGETPPKLSDTEP